VLPRPQVVLRSAELVPRSRDRSPPGLEKPERIVLEKRISGVK